MSIICPGRGPQTAAPGEHHEHHLLGEHHEHHFAQGVAPRQQRQASVMSIICLGRVRRAS